MSSVSTTNISGTDNDFGRPSGTGVSLYRYPGTSYLATIMLSLRDKIHSSAEALLKLTLMGMRSRASGVARLEAVPAFYAYSRLFVRLFTFYGRATPDAQERIYRATRADHLTARREAHPSYGGCQAWIVGAGDYFIFLMRRSRAICGDAQSAVSRRTLPCKALVTQPRNA